MPPVLTPHALADLPPSLRGGVVAVGNFDGVHRGHAELVRITLDEARRRTVPAVVLTFEPHPRSFFQPASPVFRLTPLVAKAEVLTALGIDGIAVAGFDRAFAAQTADEFAEVVLRERLGVSEAVVGHDFRYGRGRAGTTETLVDAGRRLGFPVRVIAEVADDAGSAVSSSTIRDALAAGDIRTANALLGYRWFISGEVIGGERRGRDLGFPTANIRLPPESRLRHGIYAVRVRRGSQTLGGVASFGRRPTFDNGAPLLETFIFDFAGDLYGETLTISFLEWIRPELRFDSVEALVAEIGRDSAAAREILAAAGEGTGLDRSLAGLAPPVVGPPPIG